MEPKVSTTAEKLMYITQHEIFGYYVVQYEERRPFVFSFSDRKNETTKGLKSINLGRLKEKEPWAAHNDYNRRIIEATSFELAVDKAYEFVKYWETELKDKPQG